MPKHSEEHEEGAFCRFLRSVGPDATPTPGFEERLLERMQAKARAQRNSIAPQAGKHLKRVLVRLGPATAAAFLLAIGLWWLLAGDVSVASADFGEMLRRVREARSVTYDVFIRQPGQPTEKIQVSMARPSLWRAVWQDSGRVQISDAAKGRVLSLWPTKKQAILRNSHASFSYHEPLTILEGAGESAGRLIGRKMLNNKEALVYELANQRSITHVWVDAQQNVPVRIETKSTRPDGQEFAWVLDNFRWNTPIPNTLFAMKVPADYTLEDREKDATQESLLTFLKISAEMSGGSFPADLEINTILDLVLTSSNGKAYRQAIRDDKPKHGTAVATGAATITVMDDESKEKFRACRRGMAFIKRVDENGHWKYMGANRRFGDKTAVLCWWKLPNSQTYRVVYGDLTVKDIAANALPTLKEYGGG